MVRFRGSSLGLVNSETTPLNQMMDRVKEFQEPVKKYKQPKKGVISSNCKAKRCSSCYKLSCSHNCHTQ